MKALFFPAGIGLAHTGRLVMVARELQKKGIAVIFGAGEDALNLLEKEKLPYRLLPEFKREMYERTIKNNNWNIYTTSIIERFVKAEIDLINKVKPDLIVSDLRITAKISSKIAKIPLISVANVNATRYYDFSRIKIPYKSYLGNLLPVKVVELLDKERGQKILKRLAPNVVRAIFLKLYLKFNLVMAKHHLKPLIDPYDLAMGDLTILADIPEFRPFKDLPENVKIVGPIFWDGVKKLPSWAKKIRGLSNIVYVTASGTGDKEIFLKILEYLKDSGMTIVATTGNTLKPKDVDITYSNLYVTDYLPGKFVMSRAKLIIFPGGNATAYQSLKYGVPQIGTPLHIDQEDNMNQLVRLGTGILLNPRKDFSREILLSAIDKIMKNKHYKENTQKIRSEMRKYHGTRQAAEEIINFLKYRKGKSE